ncbi:MAG: hypothetical protein ACTSUN_00875 [Promethearchaeota archaeon]
MKFKNLREKLLDNENEMEYLHFLAAGLYQVHVGVILNQLIKILNSLSIIIFYPFITAHLLNFLLYFSFFLIVVAFLILMLPFLKNFIKFQERWLTILKGMAKTLAIITFISFPIGTFLALRLWKELKGAPREKNQEKISLLDDEGKLLFIFQLTCGILLSFFGIFLMAAIYFIILEEIAFLYPYMTYDLVAFLIAIAWSSLILGILLLFFATWMRKKRIIYYEELKKKGPNWARELYLLTIIFLLLFYPIGTFFGLTLLILNSSKGKTK